MPAHAPGMSPPASSPASRPRARPAAAPRAMPGGWAARGREAPSPAGASRSVRARRSGSAAAGAHPPGAGGLLAKLAAYGSLRLAPDASLGLEIGRVHAPQGHFDANIVALNWRWELDHPQHAVPATQLAQQEFLAGIERYGHAARRTGEA